MWYCCKSFLSSAQLTEKTALALSRPSRPLLYPRYRAAMGGGGFAAFNKQYAKQTGHPLVAGVHADFKIIDEHHREPLDPEAQVEILAETEAEAQAKRPYPPVWVVKNPKTRIIGVGFGNDDEAHSNRAYQALLRNAVPWVSAREITKFQPLCPNPCPPPFVSSVLAPATWGVPTPLRIINSRALKSRES